MSARQGHLISSILASPDRRWNDAFGGGPIAVDDNSMPVVELPGGLRITILSPRRERLEALAGRWKRELAEAGLVPSDLAAGGDFPPTRPAPSQAAQPVASEEPEEAVDDGGDDISSTEFVRLTRPDIEELARRRFQPDRSEANGSSIAMLLEFEGRTVLVSGDAFAPDLERSIRNLLAASSAKRLRVDAFVVPHNGSRHNMTIGLLELLECSSYLISTDGAQFKHPNPETIAMIIEYGRPSAGEPLTLIFNYRSEANIVWLSPQLQAELNYRAIYPDSDNGAIRVDVIGSDRVDLGAPSVSHDEDLP